MTKNGRVSNLFEAEQVLQFSNYSRPFIAMCSEKAEFLKRLTKTDELFVWELYQQLAIKTMVNAFPTAQVLRHVDYAREVIIQADPSNYVSAGILSQYDHEAALYPVAYFWMKHSPAEWNWNIHNKNFRRVF